MKTAMGQGHRGPVLSICKQNKKNTLSGKRGWVGRAALGGACSRPLPLCLLTAVLGIGTQSPPRANPFPSLGLSFLHCKIMGLFGRGVS